MTTHNQQAEREALIQRLRAAVQTYPQMSEDEPGGYMTEFDRLLDEAAAALSAAPVAVPEGYALVPLEPTTEMTWAAALTADREWCYHVDKNDARKLWAAMLSAAPTPQPAAEPVAQEGVPAALASAPLTGEMLDKLRTLRRAAQRTREDLGHEGRNYPDVRVLLEFAEQAVREIQSGVAAFAAAPTPQPVAVPVAIGPKLFQFDSFLGWANHAQRAWKGRGLRSDDTLCIDAAGRICRIGRDFMRARDEGKFPVTVHMMREDMAAIAASKGGGQ